LRLSDSGVVTNYSYDRANRLLTAGSVSCSYDKNGNTITKTDATGTTTYSYDFENRLVGVAYPGGLTNSFSYEPSGKRVAKTDSSGTTFYLHDAYNVLLEMSSGGATTVRYTTGMGIDDLISRVSIAATSYYHQDGLGNVIELTDVAQNVAAKYDYDAFGSVTNQTGTVANPYKFTSREFDQDSGLYFYRMRYYNSTIGRFVSKDPLSYQTIDIGAIGECSSQSYIYTFNNPVNYVDPLGTWGFSGTAGGSICIPTPWGIGVGGSVSYIFQCCIGDCGMTCANMLRVCLGICTPGQTVSGSGGIGGGLSSCKKAGGGWSICASCSAGIISCRLCVGIPSLTISFACTRRWPAAASFGCDLGGCYTFVLGK
jgi:RHS repeat-associated protein